MSALANLDSQGVFGKRKDRVLLYHVTDAEQDADAIIDPCVANWTQALISRYRCEVAEMPAYS